MGTLATLSTRVCARCGETIRRRANEHARDHKRRKYCSRICFQEAAGSPKFDAWRPAPTLFPHAHVRRLVDAPRACPRCNGSGSFRLVENGLSCRVCGKEVIVAETLLATLRRGVTLGR